MSSTRQRVPVPRDRENDCTHEAAATRRSFAEEVTGASLEHVGSYSFDPAILTGNVEQFVGVALAGWLRRRGHEVRRSGFRMNADCAGRELGRLEALLARSDSPVVVIGQNCGGTLARALAACHPQYVAAVVTLGSPVLDPLAVHSRTDAIVDWRACLDPHAPCVEIDGSHCGMAANPHVYRELERLLDRSEETPCSR